MAFVRPRARILERTTTAGNGPYALAGPPDASYNDFASFMAVGDTTYASVVEPGVAFWTGIVTYSAADQITLTTVEETGGSFGAGTKEIFAGLLASRVMQAEDASGAIVTGGTSTAYTVASYRKFDTLARMHNEIIAFSPHVANGQTVTLNVDGLGAKPLRPRPGYELQSNALIAGTPYTALYNHVDGVFYLHAFGGGDAYGIPLGAGIDYWGATAPSTAFAFPAGQQVSRSTYAALFALIGTTYGVGDGSTTFNLPDKSGRVSAMKEASASRLTSGAGGVDGATIGSAGGNQTRTLAANQIPSLASSGNNTINVTVSAGGGSNRIPISPSGGISYFNPSSGPGGVFNLAESPGGFSGVASLAGSGSNSITVNYTNGAQSAVQTLPPLIVCNYIMRVL